MNTDLKPDPSAIGGVPTPPFVFLPDPAAVFATRQERFEFLAESSDLAPYLTFLAALTAVQGKLVAELPPLPVPDADRLRIALAGHMPPIDRGALLRDTHLIETLRRLCDAAAAIDMPEPAAQALKAVAAATSADRDWLLTNVLTDRIPDDAAAPHLFVSAAVQVHLARMAAQFDGDSLSPIRTGICPCCGGLPVSSSVTAQPGIENIRYATCASCATRWNEVRIKCLCCASTKGLSYRSAETAEASVKAECCRDCSSWIKIFYLERNPTLDPVADDVASLGLDLMMKPTGLKRAGFNPYLTGY